MSIKRTILPVCVALAGLAGGTLTASGHGHHGGDAVAAGIIGLAIGAAISDDGDYRHRDVYGPPPAPAYAPPPPFSPARDITCYPAQYACYFRNGAFNNFWTHAEFGR